MTDHDSIRTANIKAMNIVSGNVSQAILDARSDMRLTGKVVDHTPMGRAYNALIVAGRQLEILHRLANELAILPTESEGP